MIGTNLLTGDESCFMVLLMEMKLTGRVTPQRITSSLMLSKNGSCFHDYVNKINLVCDMHAVWLRTSVVQETNRKTKTLPLEIRLKVNMFLSHSCINYLYKRRASVISDRSYKFTCTLGLLRERDWKLSYKIVTFLY